MDPVVLPELVTLVVCDTIGKDHVSKAYALDKKYSEERFRHFIESGCASHIRSIKSLVKQVQKRSYAIHSIRNPDYVEKDSNTNIKAAAYGHHKTFTTFNDDGEVENEESFADFDAVDYVPQYQWTPEQIVESKNSRAAVCRVMQKFLDGSENGWRYHAIISMMLEGTKIGQAQAELLDTKDDPKKVNSWVYQTKEKICAMLEVARPKRKRTAWEQTYGDPSWRKKAIYYAEEILKMNSKLAETYYELVALQVEGWELTPCQMKRLGIAKKNQNKWINNANQYINDVIRNGGYKGRKSTFNQLKGQPADWEQAYRDPSWREKAICYAEKVLEGKSSLAEIYYELVALQLEGVELTPCLMKRLGVSEKDAKIRISKANEYLYNAIRKGGENCSQASSSQSKNQPRQAKEKTAEATPRDSLAPPKESLADFSPQEREELIRLYSRNN
ncbi:MAG: hypothetical protein KKA46_14960 [Proteobacteria bacterium]|nr:hypothetical protein [Pseudomonadota bacterium]MBV1714837.1 hypothetical protein [Desulfarculus sp.]